MGKITAQDMARYRKLTSSIAQTMADVENMLWKGEEVPFYMITIVRNGGLVLADMVNDLQAPPAVYDSEIVE